ncbi:uncharacterized protein LOC141858009 [Brevipalpus obovatus]|uniref:uncharacterized protein LOC141858009 n=1 Tax=Brevipalpus obovatus TaxID=246614 RepID=UPI003D9E89D5
MSNMSIESIMRQARENIEKIDRRQQNSSGTTDESEDEASQSLSRKKSRRKMPRRPKTRLNHDDLTLDTSSDEEEYSTPDTSSDEEYLPPSHRRLSSRIQQKRSKIPIITIESDGESFIDVESDDESIIDVENGDEEAIICIFCGSEREDHEERWLCCSVCSNYYHQECTVHYDETNRAMKQIVFICQSCY